MKTKKKMVEGDNMFALSIKSFDTFSKMMKDGVFLSEERIIKKHINERMSDQIMYPDEKVFKIPTSI